MADQGQNSTQSSIDDLVKELSRSQNVPPPPSSQTPPPPPQMAPKPMTPPPSSPTPSVNLPRPNPAPQMPPTMPSQSVPAPQMPKPASPGPQAPQGYQSNIRTMKDDLGNLKSGQQLQGVNIPRTIQPEKVAPQPTVPVKPTTPIPVPQKAPSSQISLGQPQKSAPLPSMPVPKAPPAPPSRAYSVPLPPVPAPTKLPDSNQDIGGPVSTTKVNPPRNLILMGILAAAVVLGAVYWYFVIRQPAPEVAQTTPTPSFSETPTPTPIDIFEAIFPNKAGSISLPASGDPSTTFQNALNLLNVDPGKFGVVSVVNTNPDGSVSNPLTALDLLDRFLISYPAELKPLVTTHSVILAYGQQEQFDAKGKLLANPTPSKRIVLVTEAKSSVLDVLKTWETNMTQVLAGLFGFDKTKNKGPFQDNNYQGVAIRFKNFPNPDHSIDYGVLDYNGKSYWIMASSREAMFAAIGAFIVPGK